MVPEQHAADATRGREAPAKAPWTQPLALSLAALAIVSVLFLLAPQIDVAASALFYDPATGFLHTRLGLIHTLREAGRLAAILLAVGVTAPLAVKLLLPGRHLLVRPRATLFVLSNYLLGVGLLVNFILKDHWGRARPREITEFGGDAAFTPVWWISDQCQGNCSFVSGEGAAGFWLVSLAFIVPRRWRAPTAALTLTLAALVSFTRMAMGGHFLSDVLISWLLMLLLMLLLSRIILQGFPPGFDAWIEQRLAQAGRWLRRPLALRGSRPPL